MKQGRKRSFVAAVMGTASAALLLLLGTTPGVHAQSGGATMTMVISSAIGGGNDTYGRLAARHLTRFLPNHPAIVPKNMPGAGGVVEANWLYNIAPKDGSVIGIMQSGPAFDPLLGYTKVQYDPRQFNWLLSLDSLISLAIVSTASPALTAQDLFTKKVIFGGSTGDSMILPTLLDNLLGTKLDVVSGYPGVNDIVLAMDRGEVEGFSTYWDTLKASFYHLVRDNKVRLLMQIALVKHPDLPDVPLVLDYVQDDETRQVLELILARQAVGRPIVAPPGTPPDKVKQLREAFDRMIVDPEFLDDAKKLRIEINITTGEELAALVHHAYETPPAIVEKAAQALKKAGG